MTQQINLAPSWGLIKNDNLDTKNLDWRDTQQVMDKFGLSNWDVSCETVSKIITEQELEDGNVVEQSWNIPSGANNDRVVVVRKDIGVGLAYRTSQYMPVQNETLFEFGDVLMKQFPNAKWVNAGKLGDGHKVYGIMHLPESGLFFGKEDKVDMYLTIANGHDGTMGVTAMITPIRLSCTNQLTFVLGQANHSLRTKHTLRVEDRIAIAKESVETFSTYSKQLQTIGDNLFALPCTTEDIRKMYVGLNGIDSVKNNVSEIYNGKGRPEEKVGEDGRPIKYGSMQSNKFDNAEELLINIYQNRWDNELVEHRRTSNNTMSGIENTMWGGLNALTEHLDWYQGKYKDSSKIVERQMFNSGHQKKRNAILDMVLDYNKVTV